MDFEPEVFSKTDQSASEFAEHSARKTLEILRDTERSLRLRTVDTLAPILPEPLLTRLDEASQLADESLDQLADVDLDQVSDAELQPARIQVGLGFIGVGALAMVVLLLYLYTLHPELSPIEQVRQYWHQYIWFVSLGVAGLFMLGRETMRGRITIE